MDNRIITYPMGDVKRCFMEILATRMKELRLASGLRQIDVAQALGIGIPTYCRYEYGQREPSPTTLVKMAKLYQVSTDYLLGLTD